MPAGLREAKRQRTRDELVDVAVRLFEERGFDAVTVDEIAAEALVSPRTFFRYFGSKEAVLFSDQEEMLDLLRETIRQQPRGALPVDVLRAGVSALIAYTAEHREMQFRRARLSRSGASSQTYHRAVLQPQWEEEMAAVIAEHLGVEVDVDIRPRLLAGVGIAVMAAVGGTWMASDGTADMDALLDRAFDGLAAAMGEIR